MNERLTLAEANRRTWPEIVIGREYPFHCEIEQEQDPAPERLRNYTGQTVTVVALEQAADPQEGTSPLYTVEARDGRRFSAWNEELSGWDLALGQYFWQDGTYGPDHRRMNG